MDNRHMGNTPSFATAGVRQLARALNAERQTLRLRTSVLKLLVRAAEVRRHGAEDIADMLARQSVASDEQQTSGSGGPIDEMHELREDATSDEILARIATLMRTVAESEAPAVRARIERLRPGTTPDDARRRAHEAQVAASVAVALVSAAVLDALVTACNRSPPKEALFMATVMGTLVSNATWQMGSDLPEPFWKLQAIFTAARLPSNRREQQERFAQEACVKVRETIDAIVAEAHQQLQHIGMARPPPLPPHGPPSGAGPAQRQRLRWRFVPY